MKSIMLVIALSLSGCAAYELPPLSLSHPGNPLATTASEHLPSKTLAYTRQDIPAVAVAAAQQGNHDAHHPGTQADGQKTVVGEGKVIATVPNAGQVVVEHGEIKDFMEPMTMGYKIEPQSLLEGLQSGDRVRFTIDVPRKTIVKIEKLK
jgi:Cu/Ag efflux protein CusF